MLRDALGSWQLDGCCDVAELLVDELVSNVVRHVGSPVELRVVRRPRVGPGRGRRPRARSCRCARTHPDEDHGRGILLVESLASRWGTEVNGDGKTVWFELDVPS